MRQMHATCRKDWTVEQGKIRRSVNSGLRYQKESYPIRHQKESFLRCQTWTICAADLYHKAHDLLRKARKHKSGGYKTILERWHDDDKCRKSLSHVGWTEEQTSQYDAIALEDHSYVATWHERSRTGKFWNISLNKEGIQGPMNPRSDFTEAKQKSLEKETNQSLSCPTSQATA